MDAPTRTTVPQPAAPGDRSATQPGAPGPDGLGDARFDWRTFRTLALVTPPTFTLVAALLESWTTVRWLSLATVLVAGVVLSHRLRRRALTLHLVVGLLVVYQTFLLYETREVANVGIAWFAAVPALVACLGRRSHILLWTPITLAAVTACWYASRHLPAMAHPLSLPNLVGVVLTVSIAAFAVIIERDRRERQLQDALERAQQMADSREAAEREARARAASISRFLANMSHELRSPLVGILLSSEMLLDSLEDPRHRDHADTVRRSADVLLAVTNDALELARIDARKVVARAEPFDLAALLQDLRTLGAPLFAGDAVAFFVCAAPDLHRTFVGDGPRIRQVLLNLVTNARRHTARGAVRVRAEARDDGLWFAVRDSGIGIPPEELPQIFEPFVQLRQHAAPDAPGTGLGLTICREFVEAMGGSLRADSTPGTGSTFEFWLPLRPADDERLVEAVPHAGAPCRTVAADVTPTDLADWTREWLAALTNREAISPPACGGRVEGRPLGAREIAGTLGDPERLAAIAAAPAADTPTASAGDAPRPGIPRPERRGRCLVCDDDANVRAVLRRVLANLGYEVEAAAGSNDALLCVGSASFDVIFLDAVLHDGSGLDVLREIRRREGPTAHTPVCVLSGLVHARGAALEAGADEFLAKPPTALELAAVAAKLTSGASRAP